MTRQAAYKPLDPSPSQVNWQVDPQEMRQPTAGGELSFSVWLEEQLEDLERRWSHFCTNQSMAQSMVTTIDR